MTGHRCHPHGHRSCHGLLWTLTAFCLLLPVAVCNSEEAAVPESVRILSYNVRNFIRPDPDGLKDKRSREAVAETISHLAPDIALLYEMGDEKAVDELTSLLAGHDLTYPFSTVVHGDDDVRHIAVLARWEPAEVDHKTDAYYNLEGHHVKVRRGFAYCRFSWGNGYVLHVVGAHLKSKAYHRLGQTDMRRYEARQLRYLVNDILETAPDANLLIVGDLNDAPNSSPISAVCGRRYKYTRELYDLRPVDKFGLGWTYWWQSGDIYSRIDYAMATFALLPEIDFDTTEIPFFSNWITASDHRPLVITVHTKDVAPPAEEEMLEGFHRNIRMQPPAPAETRIVGSRKVRHE